MGIVATAGNLTIIGLNTDNPKVFWKGQEVPDITEISARWDKDDQNIRIRVNGTADTLYMELVSAGITVKKGK